MCIRSWFNDLPITAYLLVEQGCSHFFSPPLCSKLLIFCQCKSLIHTYTRTLAWCSIVWNELLLSNEKIFKPNCICCLLSSLYATANPRSGNAAQCLFFLCLLLLPFSLLFSPFSRLFSPLLSFSDPLSTMSTACVCVGVGFKKNIACLLLKYAAATLIGSIFMRLDATRSGKRQLTAASCPRQQQHTHKIKRQQAEARKRQQE